MGSGSRKICIERVDRTGYHPAGYVCQTIRTSKLLQLRRKQTLLGQLADISASNLCAALLRNRSQRCCSCMPGRSRWTVYASAQWFYEPEMGLESVTLSNRGALFYSHHGFVFFFFLSFQYSHHNFGAGVLRALRYLKTMYRIIILHRLLAWLSLGRAREVK